MFTTTHQESLADVAPRRSALFPGFPHRGFSHRLSLFLASRLISPFALINRVYDDVGSPPGEKNFLVGYVRRDREWISWRTWRMSQRMSWRISWRIGGRGRSIDGAASQECGKRGAYKGRAVGRAAGSISVIVCLGKLCSGVIIDSVYRCVWCGIVFEGNGSL